MSSEDSSIQTIFVQDYIAEQEITEKDLVIAHKQEKEITATGDYLAKENVDKDASSIDNF